MVKLSIIIISYNVKFFLEQCLVSVKKAIGEWSTDNDQLKAEVFVIDNNSSDDTVAYLQPLFPFAQFIANRENIGFSKANNQGLQLAAGKYILFLNPDTILPEDFFVKCITILEKSPLIGAMGVHMIDGTGNFLKESKRGFPTTWASFCRLTGLTALFPNSELFAKYYQGHVNRNNNHRVDILSGACMLLRKEALDKSGGFDERFFMYAEDIDLSYRILQAGYINYYYADESIIHFKGESTHRDIRYIKLFYHAMIQFVQKHYEGTTGRFYVQFLKVAIWLRAVITLGGLPLKRRINISQKTNRKILFKGDKNSIEKIRSIFQESMVTESENSGDDHREIILCEGDQFSFKEIIAIMKDSPGRYYRIHASHTSAVVCSHNRSEMGEVLIVRQVNN